jgi:hypothetical protein
MLGRAPPPATPVHLRKTALAHAALQTHRAALDLRQRRALILADGQRSVAELAQLLGGDGAGLIAQLHASGYLEPAAAAEPPPSPGRGDAGSHRGCADDTGGTDPAALDGGRPHVPAGHAGTAT